MKRIVGSPGDTVAIRDAVVYRNGERVVESYLHEHNDAAPFGRDVGPVVLGEGQFFVLGDNRDRSADSRTTGPVLRSELRGRAEVVWLAYESGNIRWDRFPRRLHD